MKANGCLIAVTIIFSYSCILQSTMDRRSSDTSQGPLTEMDNMADVSSQQDEENQGDITST